MPVRFLNQFSCRLRHSQFGLLLLKVKLFAFPLLVSVVNRSCLVKPINRRLTLIMASYVTDFYNNKSVFITGGTGFVGVCLIEKLLRCCPDIKNIYLLIRPKKGKQIMERLEELTKNSVSGALKCLSNVVLLHSRITKPSLLNRRFVLFN